MRGGGICKHQDDQNERERGDLSHKKQLEANAVYI